MRRQLLVVLAVVTTGLVAGALPAAASNAGVLNREVTGPFSGTQSFSFTDGKCSLIHQVFDGSYQADGGSGAFHIDTCVTVGGTLPFPFQYSGTFSLTTPHDATLTGTATGSTSGATPNASLDLTLMLHQGTRVFRHVTGTIVLSGVWNGTFSGPISGTLTGELQKG